MKTNTIIKHAFWILTVAVGLTACKKDKKDPNPTPEIKAITINDLKVLSTSASVTIPDNRKITGVVISDATGKNIDSKTMILQDAATQQGIIVTFDSAPTFAMNDQVEINISKQTLAQVNGEIEITNVPAINAKKTGTGTITAKATTAAEITTNKALWDGTLVKLTATGLSGTNDKYTGTLTITDASGTASSNVLAGAMFENTDLPPSVSSLTGIVRLKGTNIEVDIRNTTDVTVGTITKIVNEDFVNIKNLDMNSNVLDLGFTTDAGKWLSGVSVVLGLGSQYDPNITTSGKSYVYPITDEADVANNYIMSDFSTLQGVKNVNVNFAGSITNTIDYAGSGVPIDAFIPTDDYVQIGIIPATKTNGVTSTLDQGNSGIFAKILTKSTQFKQLGQLTTFTYTVPTKEQLTTAGVSSDIADKFIANPNFMIVNFSRRHDAGIAPIFYNKITFGLGN